MCKGVEGEVDQDDGGGNILTLEQRDEQNEKGSHGEIRE